MKLAAEKIIITPLEDSPVVHSAIISMANSISKKLSYDELTELFCVYSKDELNSLDANHNSPLHLSIHLGYDLLSNVLVDLGADFNIANLNGYSARDLAFLYGRDCLRKNTTLSLEEEINYRQLSPLAILWLQSARDYSSKPLEMDLPLVALQMDSSDGVDTFTPFLSCIIFNIKNNIQQPNKFQMTVKAEGHCMPLSVFIKENQVNICSIDAFRMQGDWFDLKKLLIKFFDMESDVEFNLFSYAGPKLQSDAFSCNIFSLKYLSQFIRNNTWPDLLAMIKPGQHFYNLVVVNPNSNKQEILLPLSFAFIFTATQSTKIYAKIPEQYKKQKLTSGLTVDESYQRNSISLYNWKKKSKSTKNLQMSWINYRYTQKALASLQNQPTSENVCFHHPIFNPHLPEIINAIDQDNVEKLEQLLELYKGKFFPDIKWILHVDNHRALRRNLSDEIIACLIRHEFFDICLPDFDYTLEYFNFFSLHTEAIIALSRNINTRHLRLFLDDYTCDETPIQLVSALKNILAERYRIENGESPIKRRRINADSIAQVNVSSTQNTQVLFQPQTSTSILQQRITPQNGFPLNKCD